MTCSQDFFHIFYSNKINWLIKEEETRNENFYFRFKQYKTRKNENNYFEQLNNFERNKWSHTLQSTEKLF